MNLMQRLKPARGRGARKPTTKKKAKKQQEYKRNPYAIFTQYTPEEMYAGLAHYVQTLDPATNLEEIRIFNMLMTKIPWALVRLFFIPFLQNPDLNLFKAFDEFLKKHRDKLSESGHYLKTREATPLGHVPVYRQEIPKRKQIQLLQGGFPGKQEVPTKACVAPWSINMVSKKPIKAILMRRSKWTTDEEPVPGWFKVKSTWYPHVCKHGRDFEPSVAYLTSDGGLIVETRAMFHLAGWSKKNIAEKSYFGGAEIPDVCVSEYKTASWMKEFSPRPIKGIVIKQAAWATDEQVAPGWYKPKRTWFEYVCKNGRVFVTNSVGYITDLGEVIVETEEMYNASKLDNTTSIVALEKANDQSFAAAKSMLQANEIIPDKYITDILSHLPDDTNADMAKSLANFLVFTYPLIKTPQVFIERIRRGLYKPGTVLDLTKAEKLPEIYKNPTANRDQMDTIIRNKASRFVDDFMKRIQIDLGARVYAAPVKPEAFPRPAVQTASCPQTPNIIYYNEGGEMYCFDLEKVKNKTKNPVTGVKFTKAFKNEMKKLEIVYTDILPDLTTTEEEVEEVEDLAPGLFERLREEILLLKPVYCSSCGKTVAVPEFKSVKGSEVVKFCDSKCFERFRF